MIYRPRPEVATRYKKGLSMNRLPGNRPTGDLPIIAMTMGDAAGIGPEVIMKSLAHPELHEQCRPLVIGDAERFQAVGLIQQSDTLFDAPHRDAGIIQ